MPKLEVEKTEEIIELIPEVLSEEKKEEKKEKRPKKKRLEPDDLLMLSKVLAAGTNGNPKDIIRTELEKQLVRHNLTTDSALETVSAVMHYSKRELNRMAAAKITLELNGVMKKDEVTDAQQVVQFIFNDKVDLNGIFNPKR